jgi:hypothetical protein
MKMPGMRYVLNSKEEVVLSSLPSPSGDDKAGSFRELEEIAKKAFGDQKRGSAPKSKGNSWVRNSMRKLLRLGLVVHAPGKSGQYARTRVTLKELAAKEEARKASAKKQGDAAKPRTKAGKAAKSAKSNGKPAKKKIESAVEKQAESAESAGA